ncbi:MAG: hypothetical protein RL185_1296 [Bacteroidota bacterium]
MPTIAFIIHGLCMGGAEKFTIALLNHLHKNGQQVFLLSLSEDLTLAQDLHPDIPIITVLRNSKYDLSVAKKIANILTQNQVDKVFCVNSYSYFLTKLALLKSKKIEVFLSLHSTAASSIKNYLQNLLYFRMTNLSDRFVFLCENQKHQLKRNYFIPDNQHYVINNGIDTNYFCPSVNASQVKQNSRENYNLKEDESVILNVARIAPEKGHLDAIEALYLLHDKYKEKAHLFFVGDGPPLYKLKIKKLIAHRGLEDFVHFEGNQQDVRKYYHLADIFTLTSSHTETFSIAALEAMAFGLPCSMTEIGGANEMIVPGLNGLLTTPHDPLSIAESWYDLLSSKPKNELIRAHVLDRFKQESMFAQYDAILL